MGLLTKTNNNNVNTAGNADPYNPATGSTGRYDGNLNDPLAPTGGQINNSSVEPGYGDQTNGYGAAPHHQHNARHDAEGAALGGVTGHEYQKHHNGTDGPGAGTGAAAGAFGGHEYNKHHGNHNTNTTGAGTTGVGNTAGTTGLENNNAASGPGGQGITPGTHGGIEADREARHLNRTGKVEKAIGNVLCSTTLKQKGLQKEATAQSMQQQAADVAAAENLEAQAQLHRGHAAGLGAQPNHVVGAGGQGPTTGGPGANTAAY